VFGLVILVGPLLLPQGLINPALINWIQRRLGSRWLLPSDQGGPP